MKSILHIRALLSLSLIFALLILPSCASTNLSDADLSDIDNRMFGSEKMDVFQATLGVLNRTGFVIRESNSEVGTIHADFFNDRSNRGEDRFFGYRSGISRAVRAEISLFSVNDGYTRVRLNLVEIFPPSPAQYGSIRPYDSERRMRDARYYENLLEEIEKQLNS